MLIGEGTTHSAAHTEALGRCLGRALGEPVTWCLDGDLGSGKTVLVRGILHGLGVRGAVRSPSFTLAIPHAGRWPAVHVDLYRLESAAAVEMLAWDDWLDGDSVVLIEWGARARHLVGPDRIDVSMEHAGHERRVIRLAAAGRLAGPVGTALAAACRGAWSARGADGDGR